jgi:hypothetical protein
MIRVLIRLLTLPIRLPLKLLRAASAFILVLILFGILVVLTIFWLNSR